MSNKKFYFIGFLTLLFFDTCTQICMKLAGESSLPMDLDFAWFLRVLGSIWVYLALFGYFGSFATWMTLLKRAPIGPAFAASHLEIVSVTLVSIWLFDEPLTLWKVVGGLLIITGVLFLASEEEQKKDTTTNDGNPNDKPDSNKIKYLNLVEPDEYQSLFVTHPPLNFVANYDGNGVPVFKTKFDLLTTLETDTKRRIQKIPFYNSWAKCLRLNTCFVGTCITEYAPLPSGNTAEKLVDNLITEHAKNQALTIVKDLPLNSPLLEEEDNKFSQQIANECTKRGFFELSGQSLAYVPIDFADINDYLKRVSYSRRKNLRRKLKTANSLTIKTVDLGDSMFSDRAVLDEYYSMYVEVFKQSEIHFDFLSFEFFKELLSGKYAEGVVVTYHHKDSLVGYNICLLKKNALVDKYIGFKYPQAREFNLYFISWFYNLELAKKLNCKVYIAGWTDPEVKADLGADFTFTRHLVWIKNPILRFVLSPFKHLFEADKKSMEKL